MRMVEALVMGGIYGRTRLASRISMSSQGGPRSDRTLYFRIIGTIEAQIAGFPGAGMGCRPAVGATWRNLHRQSQPLGQSDVTQQNSPE
jgi:hypothetical protein